MDPAIVSETKHTEPALVARELIDEIRNRINLVHIVEQVVPLKKSGKNHSGLCPFHQEKSPSFTVSEDKQLYHCFGCGVGGTVYNFLMDYYHMSFPEALEKAASHAGIELKNRSDKDIKALRELKSRKLKLIDLMSTSTKAFHQALLKSPNALQARDYVKKRGLEKNTITFFNLGYAPKTWDSLVGFLEKQGKELSAASEVGLVVKKREGGYFDFFRDRLMFPIRNVEGDVIGLGGRTFGDDQPKYLNSPQSMIFDKSRNLYGLFEAKEAIRREKKIYVTEGYMDQIAMFQAGIENTVATLGTALTAYHAKLLKKHSDKVVLIFDGDAAGARAAQKAMKPLLAEGLSIGVVALSGGEDPDSYIKKYGAGKFKELCQQDQTIMQFYIQKYYLDERDLAKKTATVSELVDLIHNSHVFLQEALIREICDLAGISEGVLRGHEKLEKLRPLQKDLNTDVKHAERKFANEELLLLRLSIERKPILKRMFEEDLFSLFSSSELANMSRTWLLEVKDASQALDTWHDEFTKKQIRQFLVSSDLDLDSDWQKIWSDCVYKMKKRKITFLSKELKKAEIEGDYDSVERISMRMLELKKSVSKAWQEEK